MVKYHRTKVLQVIKGLNYTLPNKTDDKYCVLTYQFTQIAILKVLSYSSPTGPPLIGDSIPYWLHFELCVIIDPVVLKIIGVSSVKNPRTILIGG